MTETPAVLDAALRWQAAGFSVVRVHANGSKAPVGGWKTYQRTPASSEQVDAWFRTGHPGLGLVMGTVSGNAELLEFEGRAASEGLFVELGRLMDASGQGELWRRLLAGYLELTPSGGVHLIYRVGGPVGGNTKLARRPARDEELTDEERPLLAKGRTVVRVLIETRGEGGYVVVAPSHGDVHPSGDAWVSVPSAEPGRVAVLSVEERDLVHDVARLFDVVPEAEPVPFGQPGIGVTAGTGLAPGEDYNQRGDWETLLSAHGWRVHSQGAGRTFWTRPGKDRGISAVTGGTQGDYFWSWSSSIADLPTEQAMSKWRVYAALGHAGDYRAAAAALRREGYGQPTAATRVATSKAIAAPDPNERELHRGQLRFAERFTARYGEEFLHAHGIGWHRYDGTRWAACQDGAEVRAVHQLIKAALAELGELDDTERTKLYQDIRKVESAAGIAGVLDLAQNFHPCTVSATTLDANPYLLNTRSGTVHLSTGAITEPNPDDRLSKVAQAALDTRARSATFEKFLERCQPDPEMRAFLARQLGAALLGVSREHVLFIWHGVGANGKGTLRDAVLHALGDYAVEVPADLLLVSKYGQQALAPERMRLKGARIAFCSEIGASARFDEATMKKLTGGDPVNAKLLYRNPIQFDPTHTLFMLTNHLPQVRGDDPAVWRRILAVPFDEVIPPHERDGQLSEKLKAEPDAVLAWLWSGWLDYQTNGLKPPPAVELSTMKYQHDSDLLSRFLSDENAIVSGHGSVSSAQLYEAFKTWCRGEGEDPQMTNKAFTESLEKRGYRRKKTASGACWQGLNLVTDSDVDGRYV